MEEYAGHSCQVEGSERRDWMMGRASVDWWRAVRRAVEAGESGSGGGGGMVVRRKSWPPVRPRRRKVAA